MSDTKDQCDRLVIREPEAKPLVGPDAHAARLSGHRGTSEIERTRTNASDGSLRHYQQTNQGRHKLLSDWEEQNRSLELCDGDVSVSRTNPLKEINLSGDQKNANGKPYAVYTAEASQAIERPGQISKVLTEADYQSSVKLNVQITNVPEVSAAVTPEETYKYATRVLDAGAKVVRQTESHIAQPNAINSDLMNVGMHFGQSPEQLNNDVLAGVSAAIQVLAKPMTPDERAATAGLLVPMFFFEGGGKVLDGAAAKQMKLDQVTADQLQMLGIERKEMHMPEVPSDLSHLQLTKAEPELIESMKAKGREFLTAEQGGDLEKHLVSSHAEASVFPGDGVPHLIIIKPGASKVSVLEEFLHGTQKSLGILDNAAIPRHYAEVHVKDFMLRHRRMLGLSEDDFVLLEHLKLMEIQKLHMSGYRWTGL